MARANRLFLPASLWHGTHRCHQRAFLLKFAKDKQTGSLEEFQQNFSTKSPLKKNENLVNMQFFIQTASKKKDRFARRRWREKIEI